MRRAAHERSTRWAKGRQQDIKDNALRIANLLDKGRRTMRWRRLESLAVEQCIHTCDLILGRPGEKGSYLEQLPPTIRWLLAGVGHSYRRAKADHRELAAATAEMSGDPASNIMIEQLLAYGDLSCPTDRLSAQNLRGTREALGSMDFRSHPPVVYCLFSPGQSTFYIGSTKRSMFYNRLREHMTDGWQRHRGLLHDRRHEPKLKHMASVGPHRFVLFPLHFCTESSLLATEFGLLQALHPQLNSIDDMRFGTAAQRNARVSRGPRWWGRLARKHGLGASTRLLSMTGETGDGDPCPDLQPLRPFPAMDIVTYTSLHDLDTSNSLQGLMRERLYSEFWVSGNDPAEELCLAWHGDHGSRPMNLQDRHLYQIFGDSTVQLLVPQASRAPVNLRELQVFQTKQPHGIFKINLRQTTGSLTSDRDLLIQLSGGGTNPVAMVQTNRLFDMLLAVPLLERRTTRHVALRKLLNEIFRRFGAPRAPNLTLKMSYNPTISPLKVKQLVVRLVRELCLDPRLTHTITEQLKIVQTRPPTVADFLLSHKRATVSFEASRPPECKCAVLRELVQADLLVERDGHLAAKLNDLTAATLGPIQNHLKTGLVKSAAESARQLQSDLDAFLPGFWQLRLPLSGKQLPFIELDSSHAGQLARVHSETGELLAAISKQRLLKLFEDYNNFKFNYKAAFTALEGKSFAEEVADLCVRYDVALTTSTNWSVHNEFYEIIMRVRALLPRLVEGFASPLNVHELALVYYTLHMRDLMFGGNPDGFRTALSWRPPSARNPPFLARVMARTLIWAAESAMEWSGETFHYVIVPGRGSKWEKHLHLLDHPALSVICKFPPGTFHFESPHTLSNKSILDPAAWEVLVVMAATRETLERHAVALQPVFEDLRSYCVRTGGLFENPNPPRRHLMGPADPLRKYKADRWPGIDHNARTPPPYQRESLPDLQLDTVIPWGCPHRQQQLVRCLTKEAEKTPREFLAQTVKAAASAVGELVLGPMDHNTGCASAACPVYVHSLMLDTFIRDGEHFEPVELTCRQILTAWKTFFVDNGLERYGRWRNADAQLARPYLLLKNKDIGRARPIVPYSGHPLKGLLNMASRALAFMTRNADAKSFGLKTCDSFLEEVKKANDKLRKNPMLRVHARSGDVKNMFSELPHDVIKDALEWIFAKYKETTGTTCVTLGPGKSGAAFVGKKQRNHYTVMTTTTVRALLHFDLENCYYRVGERLVRQIFGVPMGSPPSPPSADLMCAYYEDPFQRGPLQELLDEEGQENKASMCRWADDVFGFFFTTCETGEMADRLWAECSAIYHESMVLETTPLDPHLFKFLSFDVYIAQDRRSIRVCQHNPNAEALNSGQQPPRPRFPLMEAPAETTTKSSTIMGAFLSAIRAATTDELFKLSAKDLITEFLSRGYNLPFIVRHGEAAIRKRPGNRERIQVFREATRLFEAAATAG